MVCERSAALLCVALPDGAGSLEFLRLYQGALQLVVLAHHKTATVRRNTSGCEALPSARCLKTSWPTTNSTFISVLSCRARGAGSIAPLVSCADNGRILLANPQVPKLVCPICLL